MFSFFNNRATLIAEIGGNHEGSISKAKDLMMQAHESGADIVKFQCYSGEGLVNQKLRPERYNHFNKYMLSDDEWIDLAETALKNKIFFSASIWEPRYFHLLNDYICLYKIGSGDLSNHNLMKLFLKTKKPFVVSTAMSNFKQIEKTYNFITGFDESILKDNRLGILQCTAMYDNPSSEFSNLLVMKEFKNRFNCLVGYSNHAVGINSSIAAISLGASILEFHFTDTKEASFRDHKLSFDKSDLQVLSDFNNEFQSMLGSSEKDIHKSEFQNEQEFRRAVYFKRPLFKGDIVKLDDLVFLRPELGISMWDYQSILGKVLNTDIDALEELNFGYFE